MVGLTVGVLGATGAVGTEMLNVLEERKLPIKELKLYADRNDAGKVVSFGGKDYVVEEATRDSFDGVGILLSAVSAEVSKIFTPLAVKKGAVVIDNSSAYRHHPHVPLIIPEVNPQAIRDHQGIIANPNCSTTVALVAINPLYKRSRIKRMIVSTYQAVSGAGIAGVDELRQQTLSYLANQSFEPSVFQHQIAFNLIPHVDFFEDNDYTHEEMKMLREGQKILGDPEIAITCTCVRVPVFRSHCESIYLEFEEAVEADEARQILAGAPGVKLVDDPAAQAYPMPIDSSEQDLIYVGRVRKDLTNDKALNLWCAGDQVRKGAATNAIQIAELLVSEDLVRA